MTKLLRLYTPPSVWVDEMLVHPAARRFQELGTVGLQTYNGVEGPVTTAVISIKVRVREMAYFG